MASEIQKYNLDKLMAYLPKKYHIAAFDLGAFSIFRKFNPDNLLHMLLICQLLNYLYLKMLRHREPLCRRKYLQ